MRFVLVHSPAVGPLTWEPVASVLRSRGHTVDVPRLDAHRPIETWRDAVDAVRHAIASIDEPVVLAGHSNAGLLLPAIAAAVSTAIAGFLFVDAPVPPASGDVSLAPVWFMDQLRSLAEEGRLPPWSTWFGAETMRDLVPDDRLRGAIVREMPSLPLTYFEEGVPVHAGWDAARCGYLLLSPAYAEDANEARRRGWPVEEMRDAEHLHLVVDPDGVGEAMMRLST